MSLGKKINQFESLTEQTLRTFNELFTDCPILEAVNADAEVEIGEVVGPDNVRRVLVDGKELIHSFKLNSDYQSLLPQCVQTGDFTEELEVRKEALTLQKQKLGLTARDAAIETNARLENLIITERELALEPSEYVLLQYLRGCQSPYHTQLEIAEKTRRAVRTVRKALKSLEKSKAIRIEMIASMHRMAVFVNEDWSL
jgi:DNA-binding MarR family transcriptional regulator